MCKLEFLKAFMNQTNVVLYYLMMCSKNSPKNVISKSFKNPLNNKKKHQLQCFKSAFEYSFITRFIPCFHSALEIFLYKHIKEIYNTTPIFNIEALKTKHQLHIH